MAYHFKESTLFLRLNVQGVSDLHLCKTLRNNATCSKAPKRFVNAGLTCEQANRDYPTAFFFVCNHVVLIHHMYHYSLSQTRSFLLLLLLGRRRRTRSQNRIECLTRITA
jgi:hypothetical protein